jgi:hypothetical protein
MVTPSTPRRANSICAAALSWFLVSSEVARAPGRALLDMQIDPNLF